MDLTDIRHVAIYARVSTDEQREGQTIDSQVAEMEHFADDKSWTVFDVYKDEGWSGGVMARPQLDRLRDDAGKGLFQAVIINDVDRLARNVAHLGIIKRDLERKGVHVVFRKLPTETSPTYDLMVNVLGSFAEFEREMIADRTRRGRRHRVEVRKRVLVSIPPYGYRYIRTDRASGEDGHLESDANEAPVVQRMFRWVADEGVSARGVVERLNSLRIPPRKGNRHWAKSSVLRILHSEVYAGTWHYNKYESFEPVTAPARYRRHLKSALRVRPKGQWIPIELSEELRLVSPDQWQRVQAQLRRNIAFSPRNEKHLYVLKGLVRCAGCMFPFVGDPNHGTFYYRCGNRCKRVSSVRDTVLTGIVWQAVERVMLNPVVIIDGLRKLSAARSEQRHSAAALRDDTLPDRDQITIEEGRLIDQYRRETITPEELAVQLERIQNRRRDLERRNREMRSPAPSKPDPMADNREIRDYCRDAAKRMASFNDRDRQTFLRLLHIQCTFSGNQVRIRGRLPMGGASAAPGCNFESRTPPEERRSATTDTKRNARDMVDNGGIAATRTYRHDRNAVDSSGIATTPFYLLARNPASGHEFETAATVPPTMITRFVGSGGTFCSPKGPNAVRACTIRIPRKRIT